MEIRKKPRPWDKQVNQGERHSPDHFYHTSEWKRVRKSFLASNPLCEHCKEKGILTQGQMVDHRLRIKAGGNKTDWSNLQTLCNYCHARKSANESNEAKREKK